MDCGKKAVETDAPFWLTGEFQNYSLSKKKKIKKRKKNPLLSQQNDGLFLTRLIGPFAS